MKFREKNTGLVRYSTNQPASSTNVVVDGGVGGWCRGTEAGGEQSGSKKVRFDFNQN